MSIRPRKSVLNPELVRPHALGSIPRDPGAVWLDKNENMDPELTAVLREVLLEIPSQALNTYPEAGELYRRLARAVDLEPEYLFLTPGSDGAIRSTFGLFVEDGDGVVHTLPTFAMYPVYSQMFGADACAIEYQRTDAGPHLDAAAIIEAVRQRRPKLLCLPNPDSPTGTVLASETLREILAECEAAGTAMLLDEAYYPFYESSAIQWTRTSRNLIVARTFAKAWGAAGLRVGYAAAHPETAALLHKMRPMYEVSTIAVEFMVRLLDRAPQIALAVARANEGKAYFVEEMRACGFRVLPGASNFVHVAFDDAGAAIHAALAGKILYRAVATHPCLAGYSRFTVAPRAIMAQVADLIKEAVGRTTK
jgi:histidinol-phosphate aminotransferase